MRVSLVRRSALAAAAITFGLTAPVAAEPVSIRNCTSDQITVKVYDDNPPNCTLRATNWAVGSKTTYQESCQTPLCWVTIELWGGSALGTRHSGLVCAVPYSNSITFAQPPCSC